MTIATDRSDDAPSVEEPVRMTMLSVILPTFNGEKYLGVQIDSILAQTHRDFELIAIDDGSDDATVAILDDYARRDDRVRRLPSIGNLGQNRRLLELLAAARGTFVAIADQDDLWLHDRNQRLVDAVGGKAMAFGTSQLIDKDGGDLGYSVLDALDVDPVHHGTLRMLFRPLVSAHAAIIRRDWIDAAAFHGPVPFDWMLAVEAMLSSGLIYVDQAVVKHRIHGGNQMNGTVGRRRRRWFSAYRLREATSFVRKDRLYFFQLLDCLGRSSSLPAATKKTFKEAADGCRYTWYQPLDFGIGKSRQLRRLLDRLLTPLATNAEDRQLFRKKLSSLTRPQASPLNMAESCRRYRRRVPW